MKQLAGKLHVIAILCFLIIGCVSETFAEKMTEAGKSLSAKRPSSQAISEFLARSNRVEKLPDITNKEFREIILRQTARAFIGGQGKSFESEPFLFTTTDTEGPWFQGWYTRITGQDGTSIAVICATQYLPERDFPIPYDMHLPGYLAVIVSDHGMTKIYESFPENTIFSSNRDQVLDNPTSSSWEEFLWHSEYGEITNTFIEISIPGKIEVSATLGPRLPYNSTIEWLGPEGLVEFLPIIPLHWFVYSLGSDSEYTYTMLDEEKTTVSGSGYAHQETNWGNVFPAAWIWSEGINSTNSRQFALSGGELSLNGTPLTTWLVAYHSPLIQWQFRPTLPETEYTVSMNACAGSFSILAKDSIRKLVISAKASPDSFIDVSVPTDEGFIPGGEESFSAQVTVSGYIKLPWFGYVLVDRYRFTNSALEFGAEYMCK